ncbi:hypothetical protein EDB85DRAFT_2073966 [Lactarius pseudohatsudake]|nr:hypothetical protein EDB85DRAFT_2073966 [Lactarius pseudohatsudake]
MVSRVVEARTLFLSSSSLDEVPALMIEQQTTPPNPNYMDGQNDVAWLCLIVFRDQTIQVDIRSRILPQTPYLSVNNINRFLSARVVSLAGLQNWVRVSRIMAPPNYVLKTLEWNMISEADEYDVQARTVVKYFLEIECVELTLIAALPSLFSAALVWLVRFVLGEED